MKRTKRKHEVAYPTAPASMCLVESDCDPNHDAKVKPPLRAAAPRRRRPGAPSPTWTTTHWWPGGEHLIGRGLRWLHEAEASRAGCPEGHHAGHMAGDHHAFPRHHPGWGAGKPVRDEAAAPERSYDRDGRCPRWWPTGSGSGVRRPADPAVIPVVDRHQQSAVDRADCAGTLGGRPAQHATGQKGKRALTPDRWSPPVWRV